MGGGAGGASTRPETGPDFDLAPWVKAVAKVDHDNWDRRHPTPYSGGAGFSWYDDNDDKSAQNFIITWGPLDAMRDFAPPGGWVDPQP